MREIIEIKNGDREPDGKGTINTSDNYSLSPRPEKSPEKTPREIL
jgi:hypothetical protein